MPAAPTPGATADPHTSGTALWRVRDRQEAAYRDGWACSMEWLAREPPEELDFESAAIWLEGYDDAADAPLGSGPDVADLMRACPVFCAITGSAK